MARLSVVQQRILAEITWDARATVEDLARRLGLRSHAVRHAIKALHGSLDLYPLCWTNPYLQGQAPHRVFFSVDHSNGKQLNALIDQLAARKEVAWLASVTGRYQFAMGLRAKGLAGLSAVLDTIDADFGGLILETHVSAILQLAQFVPWLAHIGSGKRKAWRYAVAEPISHMDTIDEKILTELQLRPTASVKEIGKACGLPPSTVSYRTERMLKEGVIIGFGMSYDDRVIGREGFVISLAVSGLGSGGFDKFFELAQRHPQINWVAKMLGQWNVEFGVVLDEVKEINNLVQEICAVGGGAVRNVSTHAIVRALKD